MRDRRICDYNPGVYSRRRNLAAISWSVSALFRAIRRSRTNQEYNVSPLSFAIPAATEGRERRERKGD